MVERKVEHEGGEFEEIEGIPTENRSRYSFLTKLEDDKKAKEEEKAREQAQKEWLNPNNPWIWDGDDD